MPPPFHIRAAICGIKGDLIALLDGTGTSSQVKSVIRICHGCAEGALARRGHLGQLTKSHGLNLSDLAYDCISDLFGRDDEGRYKALESYFSAYDVAGFSDEEVYFHLQRLSFTKVRNGLFRLYSEMDPQLARILRNIKVAVRSLGLFAETDRLSESCLVPSFCERSEHLPSAEAADLTGWLSDEASGNEFIPELLGKLAMLLREQERFSRVVPIVTVALAIRTFYEQKEIPQLGEPATVIDDGVIDAAGAINDACDEVRTRMFPKYVQRGNASAEVFDVYFQVITRMLEMRFMSHDGTDFQLSEGFLKLMPGMTVQEYRKKHRNKLEYLARLAHDRVSKILTV